DRRREWPELLKMLTRHSLRLAYYAAATIEVVVPPFALVGRHEQRRFKPVSAIFVCAYTTPPKKQITDMSQDFYSAGFAPGTIVYFSYDQSKGDSGVAVSSPFLKEEVMSLKGLELIAEHKKPVLNQGHVEPTFIL
ncbi:hypothetical protein Tco_0719054, partial [Tanacetum coccineum]